MSHFYVACDFGVERASVSMGVLHKDELAFSEIRNFSNLPVSDKESLHWNVPELYREALAALKVVGSYDEAISGISCTSWAADYMLFDREGALITPTFHCCDPRTDEGMRKISSKIPFKDIYEETGVQSRPVNALFQLGSEKSRRLDLAAHLMPVADGFNYLLSGIPKVEISTASATQLFNPVNRGWSERMLHTLRLSPKLFPDIVPAGTRLGQLRDDIARETNLEGAEIIASCSHEIAASLAALPLHGEDDWVFLHSGERSTIGASLPFPLINEASRDAQFTNELGYDGSIRFSKQTAGLWMLEECRRAWAKQERDIDANLLMHMAVSSEPFEFLINPADARFLEPQDMVAKIQAFCKETRQPIPRKPAQIVRCVLESLALNYRKVMDELEALTSTRFSRAYLLGDASNTLLNHFTANALRVPVVIVPRNAASIGNILIQAVAMGHIESLRQARDIIRRSLKTETILPHAQAWDAAYERLGKFVG
jgi:rhamnulokinase